MKLILILILSSSAFALEPCTAPSEKWMRVRRVLQSSIKRHSAVVEMAEVMQRFQKKVEPFARRMLPSVLRQADEKRSLVDARISELKEEPNIQQRREIQDQDEEEQFNLPPKMRAQTLSEIGVLLEKMFNDLNRGYENLEKLYRFGLKDGENEVSVPPEE